MRSVKVYLIRHGETEGNLANVLQGHCDFPLTPLGETQCKTVGETLSNHKWTKIFSSDLPRTLRSSELIMSKSNIYKIDPIENSESESSTLSHIPVVPTNLIRELHFGVREMLPHGTSVEDARRIKAEKLGVPIEELVDNSETTDQFKVRAYQFLKLLSEDKDLFDEFLISKISNDSTANNSIPTLLLITHGGFIKNFLIHICGKSVLKKITNCSVTILTIHFSSNNKPSFSFDDEFFFEYNTTYIP